MAWHVDLPFLSPEAALLLVSTKNRDHWLKPLAWSNTGSPRFTDFPSLCACSESSLANLIGSGLNLLCFQSHSKTECRWSGQEVATLGADQKERGLWGREWWICVRSKDAQKQLARTSLNNFLCHFNGLVLSYMQNFVTVFPKCVSEK